jgi:hypothetical protein
MPITLRFSVATAAILLPLYACALQVVVADEPSPFPLVSIFIVTQDMTGPAKDGDLLVKDLAVWIKRHNENVKADGTVRRIQPVAPKVLKYKNGQLSDGMGEPLTRQLLLEKVRSAPLQKDATLLCYYIGHGASDDNGKRSLLLDARLGLREPSLRIEPAELLAALARDGEIDVVKPRLTILLTECCADTRTFHGESTHFGEVPDPGVLGDLIASLDATGAICIASSSVYDRQSTQIPKAEKSFSPDDGGMFTKAFRSLLGATRLEVLTAIAHAASDPDAPATAQKRLQRGDVITWEEFYSALTAATNDNYHGFRSDIWKDPRKNRALGQSEIFDIFIQLNQRPQIVFTSLTYGNR